MKSTNTPKIPPDPEGLNDSRAEWAEAALTVFMAKTGVTEKETAMGDLIVDLGHLCDRLGLPFAEVVARSQRCYSEETKA